MHGRWAAVGKVPPGVASGSGGGLIGKIWEARREVGCEDWREEACGREGVEAGMAVVAGALRGEAGTELRSGAMV